MKQFRIVFKNGFYIDCKAELIEWPKTYQSKMLYLYNNHRKPIGRYNIDNIAAVIQALINLNVAYGYYMEEGNHEKQVQVGRESNDN